jgi:uncharacterized phiE125 gp8 family phage protein
MDWQITTRPACEPISVTEAKLNARVDIATDDTIFASLITAAREWCEGYQNRTFVAQTITLKMNNFNGSFIELPMPPLVSVTSVKYNDINGTEQTVATTVYGVDTTSEVGKIYLKYNQTWPSDCRGHHQDVTIVYVAGYAFPFTAVAATNVITVVGKSFSDGDSFRLTTTDNDLPDPLAVGTTYYVINSTGLTFKLATASGGSEIDITDTGTGTHFIDVIPERVRQAIKLLVNHLYEHREDAMETRLESIPMGVKSLLSMDRIVPV